MARELKTTGDIEIVLWDAHVMLALVDRVAHDLTQTFAEQDEGELLCGIMATVGAAREILEKVNEALDELPNEITLDARAPMAAVGGGS